MVFFGTLLYVAVFYQTILLVCAFRNYCPPPKSNITGAEKTFIKYADQYAPHGWYPTEVRYACNAGLGPHRESVCKFANNSNNVDWTPPIDDLLQLNCTATNYTADENDTVESLCQRHGGYYVKSKRICLLIPHLHIHGNERYETCNRLATVFGNANLRGRPWIVADGEAYNILINVIFGPKRAMRNSSGNAAYGPTSNYMFKQMQQVLFTSLAHGYWQNGNRVYPDADTCDNVDYCTDDVIEAKGPGDHTEILDGSWAMSVEDTGGVYDLWTSANGINTNMCLLAWSQEYIEYTDNTYSKTVWMETVFCDGLELTSTISHYPSTLPVICELLVWPPTCEVPSMSADVVLMDGSSPVVTEINVGVPLSIKCSQPAAAYVVADGQSYIQLDINCIQSKLELPRLSHNMVTCAQVGCGNVSVMHVIVEGSQSKPQLGFIVGEVAKVVCNEGYDTEVKNADSVMCVQDNSTADNDIITVKWNTTIPECIETSPCNQRDLKLPCGADRFIFTHTNGTKTKDLHQATYPHGTKVQTECHRNCPGPSEQENPTGMRECRFGIWHGCFHKCSCNTSKVAAVKCQQSALHRGWFGSQSEVVEWRLYANPNQCCYICSLLNHHNGTTNGEGKCLAFNLRKAQYGVECQFFNQSDIKAVFDKQFYYFNLVV